MIDDPIVYDTGPPVPLEFRAAETVGVRFPERIISLVVVPYEAETRRVARAGNAVTETFARGSFDGVERRTGKVKVNRDHDLAKTVGRVVSLHPYHDDGLHADLRIGKSDLGDETLEYANDGIIEASVGFAPMPGGELWTENRQRRRITKAWLGHIALVPDPAYDGTSAMEVRAGIEVVSTTPLKDAAIAKLLELGLEVPGSLHPQPDR